MHLAVVDGLVDVGFSFLSAPHIDLDWVQVLCVHDPKLVRQIGFSVFQVAQLSWVWALDVYRVFFWVFWAWTGLLSFEKVFLHNKFPQDQPDDQKSANDHDQPKFELIIPDISSGIYLFIAPKLALALVWAEKTSVHEQFAVIVKSVLEVFCWAGVNALFCGWNG